MQNILDHIQCGIFVLAVTPNAHLASISLSEDQDLNLQFIDLNHPFVIFLLGDNANIKKSDLVGKDIARFLPIDLVNLLTKKCKECLRSQQVTEFTFKTNNSRNSYLSISLSLKIENSIPQIIGTCQNLIANNEYHKKYHVSPLNDSKFSHLVNASSDALVVVDREGIVRYINHSAEELFGCKTEDMIGEIFGLPIVVGESTDVHILNRGKTTSAEMRVSETVDADRMVYVVASLRDVSERNRVEESLKLRERAIAASSNGIVITDATKPDNPMIYVNPSFERITGYSASEVIGRDCRFLQGGDRNQIGILDLRQAIQEQRECHAVLLNYRKDGTPFWNDLYIAPVFNDRGELTNYIGIQTDITEQVKSTQRLLESEERLRTVLTSIKEGITFSDDSGYFSIFNDGMENLTGYTIAEANSSKDFTNFLYPDSHEHNKALQRLQKLQETGQAKTIETRICHKYGTFKDVLVSTKIMIYKGKRMYLSSYYDITERKQVETQLRYQSERERLLNVILLKIQRELNLDQILSITVKEAQELLRIDRVVIYEFQDGWSGKFVVEAVNDPSLSIVGSTINDPCFNKENISKYKSKPIISINDIELSDLTDCHKELLHLFNVKANIVVAISFGDTLWGLLIAHQCFAPRNWEDFEIDLLRQLANHLAIAIQQVQLFERVQELNKNLERQVADRTQQLEQSLSQLERALLKEKELNELKSQFISRASHEFRTPLATIQTASDLLRNYGHKMSDDKKLERIDKIQREVKGMTSLLEEVLVIGKTESGKFELQPEDINLDAFCLELIEQSKLLASNHHQVIFKNINAPQHLVIDTKFFKQIISNLLSNAIKYSPEGGEVKFTVSLTSDLTPKLQVEIKDQGIGIPQVDQDKIFEHFYRANNVGMISGTGLGMAIIKNSIDIMGGSIQVGSIENIGTTVQVKLPITLNS